jgi:Ni/Fe-hydrogenase subunit HybB-like protein
MWVCGSSVTSLSWKLYVPRIEILLSIGTLALFILIYLIASRLIPLVPVWEVQEGQMAHGLRKVGKATVKTLSDIE